MNKDCPLWLPKGSVRSLLALGLVAAVVYLAIPALGGGKVPDTLTTLAGMVLIYYFKTREAAA